MKARRIPKALPGPNPENWRLPLRRLILSQEPTPARGQCLRSSQRPAVGPTVVVQLYVYIVYISRPKKVLWGVVSARLLLWQEPLLGSPPQRIQSWMLRQKPSKRAQSDQLRLAHMLQISVPGLGMAIALKHTSLGTRFSSCFA